MADIDSDMADEYDFSGGQRGRFYSGGAVLLAPIHVEPDVLESLTSRAAAEGVPVNELASRLLRRELKKVDPVG